MTQPAPNLRTETVAVDNGAGWSLCLRRHRRPGMAPQSRPPVVLVPGYAMNSHILGFHPTGRSMIGFLVDEGFEVWTADLRSQGERRHNGPRHLHLGDRFGIAELALEDLPRMLERVRVLTETGTEEVHAVGCSLGGSLLYAYLAHHPNSHGLRSLTVLGGPLRWDAVHPALRFAFVSGRLAGLVPFPGTRALARAALPVLKRVPSVLNLYLNPEEVDLSQPDELTRTVENPVPYINRQVARWVARRDLVVRGVNCSSALQGLELDVHCILANKDGIVPQATAASAAGIIGRDRVWLRTVGTPERWYAHADLFIGPQAEPEVFAPMAAWMAERSSRVGDHSEPASDTGTRQG